MSSVTLNAKNLAIICPTKDRPKKVRRLLASIAASTIQPGQVMIADGGHNLKPVVADFATSLNIECHYCPEPGQIMQRNYAHKYLQPDIRLVLHLDDDITLAPDALAKALAHWNRLLASPGKPLAGMALNIVGHPAKRNNPFRSLALMKVEPKGKVWASGFASPHVPVSEDGFSDWLVGGATIWSRDILETHKHPLSFRTRWAFCEDVLFSYPLANTHRMAVCAAAHVQHNDSYNAHSVTKRMFYAKTQVFMRYYLISLNAELSFIAFSWMIFCQMLGYLAKGLLGNRGHLGLFLGTLQGALMVWRSRIMGVSAEALVRGLVK